MESKNIMQENSIESTAWSYIRSLEKGHSISTFYDCKVIEVLQEILRYNFAQFKVDMRIRDDKKVLIKPEIKFIRYADRERETIGE